MRLKLPPDPFTEERLAQEPLMQRRVLDFKFEMRDGENGSTPRIVGHASVFEQPQDLGYFIETVKKGAFSKTIVNDDIRALFNHDANLVLGRNRAGTLNLREDDTGLWMEIVPSDRSYEVDLMKSIRRGDVSQASIGFIAQARTWREVGDDLYRDLDEVQLFDVSPVTFPAFPTTDVSMRSALLFGCRSARAIAEEFRSGPDKPVTPPTPDPSEVWKEIRRRELLRLEFARD